MCVCGQINEFVKLARAAKINALIISHLRNQMPTMMGKAKAQQNMIDNLQLEFNKVGAIHSPRKAVWQCRGGQNEERKGAGFAYGPQISGRVVGACSLQSL